MVVLLTLPVDLPRQIMLGDAALATEMAAQLLEEGIFVVGFSFPVVPRGQARIRCAMCVWAPVEWRVCCSIASRKRRGTGSYLEGLA